MSGGTAGMSQERSHLHRPDPVGQRPPVPAAQDVDECPARHDHGAGHGERQHVDLE